MKKILALAILTASTGLLGYDLPNNAQTSRPNNTNQSNTTANIIAAEVLLASFSPQRGQRMPETPENDGAAHRMQRTFRRNIVNAAQEMHASRPTPVVVPQNNFATDPSDTHRTL